MLVDAAITEQNQPRLVCPGRKQVPTQASKSLLRTFDAFRHGKVISTRRTGSSSAS